MIINDGAVLEYGGRQNVLHSPEYVETARLLGFQIFPLDHRGGGGLCTPAGEHLRLGRIISPGTEYVCIKPENIMVLRDDKTHSPDLENVVSGQVLRLHPRATHAKITFSSHKGEEYIVHAPSHVVEVMNLHPR